MTIPAETGNTGNPNTGSEVADWRAGLDETIRGEKVFESIKGKDWSEAGPALAKGYLESQKFVGGSIRVPKDDAKPEEWDAYYTKLGRPAKPEEYGIKAPDDMPVGLWEDDEIASFMQHAHKNGLTKKQAESLAAWQAERVRLKIAAGRQQHEAGVEALKTHWGPTYDRHLALSRRSAKQLGGEELLNLLSETGFGNHPVFVKAFAKAGSMMAEHGYIEGDTPAESGEVIQSKIDALMKSPEYRDPRDPGHAAAVTNLQKLFAAKFPEKR